MPNTARLADTIIERSPIGGAYNAAKGVVSSVGRALGLGKGADKKKYAERQEFQRTALRMAEQGDYNAWVVLAAIGRIAPMPWESPRPLTYGPKPLPVGWTSGQWGEAYKRLIDRAREGYYKLAPMFQGGQRGNLTQSSGGLLRPPTSSGDFSWPRSPGSAPTSAGPSWNPTENPTWGGDAQPVWSGSAAPASSRRPCKYGPRDPDTGRCPKKATAGSSGGRSLMSGGRSKRPCKYGPRDPETGLCPKKPSATYWDKASQSFQRRAITAGGTAASNVAKTVLKNLGPAGTMAVVAKATLVGAAGLAAYWLTSKLMTLRAVTWEEVKRDASLEYKHARDATAASLGRPLTLEELRQFSNYFKSRLALIRKAELAGLSPNAGYVFED